MQTESPSLRDLPAPVAEDTCSTCGGDGYLERDAFSPRRGHYSVSEPCSDCGDERDADASDALPAQTHDEHGRRQAVIL